MAVFFVASDGGLKAFQASSGQIIANLDDLEVEKPSVDVLMKMTKAEMLGLMKPMGCSMTNSNKANKLTIANKIVEHFKWMKGNLEKKRTTASGAKSSQDTSKDKSEKDSDDETKEDGDKSEKDSDDETKEDGDKSEKDSDDETKEDGDKGDNIIRLMVIILDEREGANTDYMQTWLRINKRLSISSLLVMIGEKFVNDTNHKKLLVFRGEPLIDLVKSIEAVGIKNYDEIRCRLLPEDSKEFEEVMMGSSRHRGGHLDMDDKSDKDSEDKSEKDSEESYDDVAVHTWTERDQKSLDYLTNANRITGIRFNADTLDILLKKKIASLADGKSLNEATEDTIPMTLWVERLNGKSKLIYNITKSTTGKDLNDALETKGIDMEYVAVKWAGDGIHHCDVRHPLHYACNGTEFDIRPVVMGQDEKGGDASLRDMRQFIRSGILQMQSVCRRVPQFQQAILCSKSRTRTRVARHLNS